MAMKDNNDLIRDIKEHLDNSVETLDPEILSKIRAARYNALEKKRPGLIGWAFPAGGIAVAIIVLFIAVNLLTGPVTRTTHQPQKIAETPIHEPDSVNVKPPLKKDTKEEIKPGQIELVEILASDQQLDFYEDLEFYAWLSENENITG
jgi:hypothetical protein